MEDDTIDTYNQFALVCRENGDSISMKIFEDIIEEERSILTISTDSHTGRWSTLASLLHDPPHHRIHNKPDLIIR